MGSGESMGMLRHEIKGNKVDKIEVVRKSADTVRV